MNPVRSLLVAFACLPLFAAGCGGASDDAEAGSAGAAASEDNLTAIKTGTFVVDHKPFFNWYLSRITFSAGKKYEAEVVDSSGKSRLSKGTYGVIAARPNNPQSPVKSDKPVLFLEGGFNSPPALEFDVLDGGGLELFYNVRSTSFTMKRDPNFKPAPTVIKTIACTGEKFTASLALESNHQVGTLTVARQRGATADAAPSVKGAELLDRGDSDGTFTRLDGGKGMFDYFVNIRTADLSRSSGSVGLFLRWARDGEEFSADVSCAYAK